jgi:hypothetical protein
LPPWSRLDARYCGDTCRQRAHREWRRASRSARCENAETSSIEVRPTFKVRDRAEQITDLEALMASLDTVSERVMAAATKIAKP